MKLTPLHERLLADILDLGSPYPLVLTGGYAVQAHGLVERFSRDLDVATENPAPMDEIVAALTAGLTVRGWRTTHVQARPYRGVRTAPLMARRNTRPVEAVCRALSSPQWRALERA